MRTLRWIGQSSLPASGPVKFNFSALYLFARGWLGAHLLLQIRTRVQRGVEDASGGGSPALSRVDAEVDRRPNT